jgi:hypothetical protein
MEMDRMSEPSGDAEQNDNGLGPARRRQLRINAEIQAAEAQKVAARAAVKNARYLLLAVIIAAVSTIITTAGSVFGIIFNFYHSH